MRKTVLSIHLFFSLMLGLFIVTTCTTGSLLLIEPEVERWMHPIGHKPSSGDVGILTIKQQADALSPDLKTDRIELPAQDGFYHVHIAKEGGKGGRLVYGDPGTGEVFGQVQEARMEPFATIYDLHRYFLLTNMIGKAPAASFVGFLGAGMMVILLTGIYMWWPGIKKWALGFRIIRNRGKLAHHMSLHKTIGIVSIPVLLVITLTGVINAYEKSIPAWIGFKAKEEVPASAMQSKSKDQPILPVDKVAELVHTKYPDSQLIKIQLPAKVGQTYQIGLRESFGASSASNSTVYMDASSGEVIYKTNPNLAINIYNTWRKGLHFATWGGETTKLIYFLFGMMPLVLMITGVAMWRLKARARKRQSKKNTAAAAA
ncbi:PepSY-associated TM helix domain-containing protein [Paenibacillus aestuarii]|uniref:PepSY-associated TM helix domain-containing protein n=1 Tax=Paenibacillus aestuarii TaxID=516965 RepID=A0ABW0K6G2_9BACL|nr:PepSY-associated TM helix domain-containing protein [Paenibacillus aestuarii]